MGLRNGLGTGPERDDSGWGEIGGKGALIEACAVFAEMEEVGGPDDRIERVGVLKSV